MDIELQAKLLKLKGLLNEVNHVSYTYSQIGKNNPMHELTNEKARQLIGIYEDLLQNIRSLLNRYEP